MAINFDVATETSSDGSWNDTISAKSWDYNVNNVTYNNNVISSFGGINSSYLLNGSQSGTLTGVNFDDLGQDKSATFETVVKASDLLGKEVIFETGGTDTGLAIYFDDGDLTAMVKNGVESKTLTNSVSDNSEFIHIVLVYEVSETTSDKDLILYVDGVLVGTVDADTISSWTSGDSPGFLAVSGQSVVSGLQPFSGEIAKFKFYNSTALTTEDVEKLYDGLSKVNGLEITEINGSAVSSSITLPSGAILTYVNGDLSYDPNGAFDYLNQGESATDSFTYTAVDSEGNSSTSTVTLTIDGVNSPPLITTGLETETIEVDEGETVVFKVDANDPEDLTNVTYSISGGYDAADFDIDPVTGILSFKSPKVYNGNPTDQDNDNLYTVELMVTDSGGLTDTKSYIFEVLNVTPVLGLEFSIVNGVLIITTQDEVDVAEYQVYNIENSELVLVVDATTGKYEVELPDDVSDIYIVVVDHSGLEQRFYPESDDLTTITYNLTKGWNLIAMPGANADISQLKAVTSGDIWYWDGDEYQVTKQPKAGEGVWVFVNQNRTISITATKVAANIELKQGWNLVGSGQNQVVPEKAHTVFTWQSIYHEIAKEHDILIKGVGYWIFSF